MSPDAWEGFEDRGREGRMFEHLVGLQRREEEWRLVLCRY